MRFVAACVGIGIGYEQTENLALNLNMGTVRKATWDGCKAIFETYSSIALCSKLLFKCSTNTAESGNCVLWIFWLPKTMLKPRSAAMALDLAMLHKAIGRQHAVAAMQGGLGLEVPGLVEAARIKKDKKSKRQGPIFVKSRKTTKTPTPPPSFTN